MADNVEITQGSGTTIAADEIGGVKHQRVKVQHGADGFATDVSAASPMPVVVSGYSTVVVASKTRPNDTNDYAAGDVINESASAGTGITLSNCARNTGGTGVIVGIDIIDSSNEATLPALMLYIFSIAPGADNDNAAFTPSDTEMESLVGHYTFDDTNPGTRTTGTGGNSVQSAKNLLTPFKCETGDANLYAVLVLDAAYTPIAQEKFTIKVRIIQD